MARIDDFRAFVANYQEACERGELEMASEETTRTWINQMLAVFGWDVRNTNHALQEVPLDVAERAALSEIGSKYPPRLYVNEWPSSLVFP